MAVAGYAHRFERLPRAVRAEIARSPEPSVTVARRYGISAEPVRKWRKRGAADCLDRFSSEVLGITVYSRRDLEQLLRDFNAACNDRHRRVLDGRAPNQVTAERLKARRKLF